MRAGVARDLRRVRGFGYRVCAFGAVAADKPGFGRIMKRTKWKQIGLAGLLAASCVGFGLSTVSAQNNDASAVQLEPSAASTPNAPPDEMRRRFGLREDSVTEASARDERRDAFRNSFDKQGLGQRRQAVVTFGRDAELKTNQTAEAVVAIGGDATARGKVRNAVVAIGGNATIDGAEVGDAVVAVLGNVKVSQAVTRLALP